MNNRLADTASQFERRRLDRLSATLPGGGRSSHRQAVPSRSPVLFTCGGMVHRAWCRINLMTRDQIQTAVNESIPFEIRMADGEKYGVQERFQVAVERSSVVVFDNKDLAHIRPMLTMTGITYLKRNGKH